MMKSPNKNWLKIGEHPERETLEAIIEKLRRRWFGRYDFQISPSREERHHFELLVRHR